jgi:hypothetical protein
MELRSERWPGHRGEPREMSCAIRSAGEGESLAGACFVPMSIDQARFARDAIELVPAGERPRGAKNGEDARVSLLGAVRAPDNIRGIVRVPTIGRKVSRSLGGDRRHRAQGVTQISQIVEIYVGCLTRIAKALMHSGHLGTALNAQRVCASCLSGVADEMQSDAGEGFVLLDGHVIEGLAIAGVGVEDGALERGERMGVGGLQRGRLCVGGGTRSDTGWGPRGHFALSCSMYSCIAFCPSG